MLCLMTGVVTPAVSARRFRASCSDSGFALNSSTASEGASAPLRTIAPYFRHSAGGSGSFPPAADVRLQNQRTVVSLDGGSVRSTGSWSAAPARISKSSLLPATRLDAIRGRDRYVVVGPKREQPCPLIKMIFRDFKVEKSAHLEPHFVHSG